MELHIKNFINGDENATPAFVRAISAMNDGDTLFLENKKYHFYPDGAFRKEYFVSNNDSGEKAVALPLVNKKNLTVDGCGADLVFHGNMMPAVIDGCDGVTLKNFSIDYHKPFYAQAKIAEATENAIVLEFDGEEFSAGVKDGKFLFYCKEEGREYNPDKALSLEFDENGHPATYSPPYYAYMGEPRDHGFLSWLYKDVKLEALGENRILMSGDFASRHKAGKYLVMTYAGRKYPGILSVESKNVTLENIRLYYTASMGIVAEMTENITLRSVVAEPRENSGRLLSTNADATHFINCRGLISITDSKFVQMMDDAVNIHGIYNTYVGKSDGELILGIGHPQHKGMNVYRKGDRVAVINAETNETVATGTVIEAKLVSPEEVRLKLDSDVPEPNGIFVTENLSTAPDAYFNNCETGHNRPRGFLISTVGKVIVENSRFYNMNQGVQISGEMKNWYESGAVSDVTIRNCDFTNSAYAGGVAILCRPEIRNKSAVFNKKVTVENNLFSQGNPRICYIESCEQVVFKNNKFIKNPALSAYKARGENGTEFVNCTELINEDNQI